MQVIIDRFEGKFAVVETLSGETYNIPAALLQEAHEGDVIEITVNHHETSKRKAAADNILNKLWHD